MIGEVKWCNKGWCLCNDLLHLRRGCNLIIHIRRTCSSNISTSIPAFSIFIRNNMLFPAFVNSITFLPTIITYPISFVLHKITSSTYITTNTSCNTTSRRIKNNIILTKIDRTSSDTPILLLRQSRVCII